MAIGISAGLRPQPTSEIVADHQVPAAEELGGEKILDIRIAIG